MANFDDLLNGISTDISSLAINSFSDYSKEAKQEAEALINELKQNMDRWIRILDRGQIDVEDFVSQMKVKMSTIDMKSLKQKGLSSVKIDTFKNDALKLIIGKVINLN